MYTIATTARFEKDLRRCKRRGLPMEKMNEVLRLLSETGTLPARYRMHKLTGNYSGCWECHIQPDWLLVWRKDDKQLVLLLMDTGTHAELFGK